MDSGELSDASKEIEKLIHLCEEVGVVKVLRNGKPKCFRWQIGGVTEVEYAFVNFQSEDLAKQANQKLDKEKKKMTVSLSVDMKSLFIGNLPVNTMKDAVEEASQAILKVRLSMANPLVEQPDEVETNEIRELIDLLDKEEDGVVKVVRNSKQKNFQLHVRQVMKVEYAFVKFRSMALMAHEKLTKHDLKKKNTVFFSEYGETLFIGNVPRDDLDMAVEEAGLEILKVRLAMMEIMGELSIMRYTVGGIDEYRLFIKALREKLTKRKDGSNEEIKVGDHCIPVLPSEKELMKMKDKQDPLLLHIELHAKAKKQNSNGSWTTTLAMRKDNLYIVGFTGKGGKWFELAESRCGLPKEYHATLLTWDTSYKSIMNLQDQDQVKRMMRNTRLGKAFAMRAVRRLSQYPDHDYNDENPTRLGLAGLIVLICESARMETICNEFQNKHKWGGKGVVINDKVLERIWDWGTVSAALRRLKKHDYKEEYSGAYDLRAALDLRLVLNSKNVRGGARVEIFAVSANFNVTSIIVNDSNGNDHIIYKQMEQGKEKEKRVITPPKNKLFVTWNIVQPDYVQTMIQKAVKQFSNLGISNITMRPLSDHKMGLIIIQFRNEDLAESALQLWNKEQVTISREDPRIKAKGMDDLELNVVRYGGISGHKWFDLDIKFEDAIPQGAVKWTLDCRKQGDSEFVTRNIVLDSQRKMDITYLVMSDPVKAKVEVSLRYRVDRHWFLTPRGDGCTVHGEIAARIDGFDHPIVLFRIKESKAKSMAAWLIFPLERSDFSVPRDCKRVHIEMKHLYVTAGDQKVVSIPDSLRFSFDLGDGRPSSSDDDNEVEVNIAWDGIPQKSREPDVKWIVDDDAQAFTDHVKQLRKKVAMGNDDEHVLESYTGTDDLKDRPILAKPGHNFRVEAERCVYIELQAKIKEDPEIWSTTLAVRNDNCSGVGFMNKSKVWYDLGYMSDDGWRNNILPAEHNSVFLGWKVGYNQILQASDWRKELNKAAGQIFITKFVMNAVRTLSRYPDVQDDDMNPRIAVVALMIVSCESAKLEFLHKSFEAHWGANKVEFVTEDMKDHVSAWEEMSRTLMHWKYHFYRSWPETSKMLKQINITSQGLALDAVHLVLNRPALPDQIDVTYTIDDDVKQYTKFIDELRRIVTSGPDEQIDELRRIVTSGPDEQTQVGLLARRPGDGHGPIWWNIQLNVAGKETSITLALRGHDLRICGFRGRNNIWYQLREETKKMFEQGYDATTISLIWIKNEPRHWYSAYGKTAAMKAVDALSRYSPDPTSPPSIPNTKCIVDEDGTDGLLYPLMTLYLMVSYSASIRKVHDAVEQGWRLEGKTADPKLLKLMSFWDDISLSALKLWSPGEEEAVQQGWLMEGRAAHLKALDSAMGLSYQGDYLYELLESIGIKSRQDVLEVFALIKDAGDQ